MEEEKKKKENRENREKKKRRKDKKGEQYISPLSRVEDGVTPSTFLLPVDNLGCVEISQLLIGPASSPSDPGFLVPSHK